MKKTQLLLLLFFILFGQLTNAQTLIEQEYRVEDEEFVPITSTLSHDNKSIIVTIRHGNFEAEGGSYSPYNRPFLLKFNAQTLDFEEKIELDYEDIDSMKTVDFFFNIVKTETGYLLSHRYFGEIGPAYKCVVLKLDNNFNVINHTIISFENLLGGQTEGAADVRGLKEINNRYFLIGQRLDYDTLEQVLTCTWIHEIDEDLNIIKRNDAIICGLTGLSTITPFQDSIFILTFGISPVNYLVGVNDEGFHYLGGYNGDFWGDRRQMLALSDSLIMSASLWIEPVHNPPLMSYGGLYLGLWNYYTGDTSNVSYTYFRNAAGEVAYPEISLGLARRYGISYFHKDKIYLAGSLKKSNSSFTSPYGSYSPYLDRGFYVCQTDSLANVQWFHPYGDSQGLTYSIRGVLATEDGGCIVYGIKNKLGTEIDGVLHIDSTASLILFKIDSLGIVTGTKEIAPEMTYQQLSIYPNPSDAKVNFELDNDGPYVMKIVNAQGQWIISKDIHQKSYELDISDWSKGIYYVSYWKKGQLCAAGQFVKI